MEPDDPNERRRALIALGMIGARNGRPVSMADRILRAMGKEKENDESFERKPPTF